MANFINGLRVFKPHEKAPDFIKANLVINCKELVEYMRANHTDGQMRVDIKLAKTGNLYAELNTFKKGEKQDWANPDLREKMSSKETMNVPVNEQDYPPMPEEEPISVQSIPF